MRMFKDTGYYGNTNWVDKNGVAAGYSLESSCCENVGFEYSRTPGGKDLGEIDTEPYSFDQTYFNENVEQVESLGYGFDSGGAVAFKLVKDNDPNDVIYLTFYNCHNGYYGHGFEFKVGENMLHEGTL